MHIYIHIYDHSMSMRVFTFTMNKVRKNDGLNNQQEESG